MDHTTQNVQKATLASVVSNEQHIYQETGEHENEALLEDGAMPGFFSLKDLNSMLLKYIGNLQDLELGKIKPEAITVKIDRSEISSLQSKYEDYLEDWKKQCAEKDRQIADLTAEITKIAAQVKKLKESNANKDWTIQDRDLTIEGLRAEISKLQANLSMFQNQKEIYELKITRLQYENSTLTGELNVMTNSFAAEQSRCLDLGSRLASMEKDLRFKIRMQENELVSERGKTNMDISSLDTSIQGEYAERLKAELKILKKMYEDHMRVSKDTLEMIYKDKISDLELSLAVQMNTVQPAEDQTELKIHVEQYKKKIEELNDNNSDINMQWSKLTVELRDKETSFHAKMSAKEIEMAHLAKLNTEYKRMYEEMRSRLLHDQSEVKVFNRLIAPEMDRMTRYKSSRKNEFTNGKDGSRGSISDESENGLQMKLAMAKGGKKKNKNVLAKVLSATLLR